MKQATLAALLGRPLTANETTNYKLYLKIAKEKLEDLVCFSFTDIAEERTFKARGGYTTVFTGPFIQVSDVTVNGTAVATTEYTSYLWDTPNAEWYNSIVFNDAFSNGDEVVINASWGFADCMPHDLQQLLAKLFALVSAGVSGDVSVQNKKVEDFSITFANADKTSEQQLYDANNSTITKYSLCTIGNVQSGSVCREHGNYYCEYC